jgi:hypothetical protein
VRGPLHRNARALNIFLRPLYRDAAR